MVARGLCTSQARVRFSYGPPIQFADVAQLVEQRIENPCVTGSNPVFGTKFRIATANSKISLLMKLKDAILFYLPA
jgi:hypothetical protein